MNPWIVACQAPLSMGFFQARILEWVAISFSRGSSLPRDWTHTSCRGIVYHWAHFSSYGISNTELICSHLAVIIPNFDYDLSVTKVLRREYFVDCFQFSSVAQSCLTLCDPVNHSMPGLPVVYPNSCPSSQWCHPAISSSVVPVSCLQSLPASESFPMSQLFA